MREILSTREAAELLGVGPSTVKRWADEGVLNCLRTTGGHRRFRASDVERLRAVQQTAGPAQNARTDRWMELLSVEQPHGLSAALFAERSRLGHWAAVADELAGVLEAIGEGWQAGRISILDEHAMSERLTRALAFVAGTMPSSQGSPTALLLAAEGDDHLLGLALAELCFREADWQTRWVGRRTPIAEAAELLASRRVDGVAISASSASTDAGALAAQARTLGAAAAQGGGLLVLGGHGAWPNEPEIGHRVEEFGELREVLRTVSLSPKAGL